jgi:hypothetical protein
MEVNMAQSIGAANLPTSNFVDNTSRYNSSTVIYYGDGRKLTFTTYKKQSYPTSPDDRFMVISKGYEYRPDLVSNKVYGLVSYWWKILEANDMKDIWDFKVGTNIRIPALVF